MCGYTTIRLEHDTAGELRDYLISRLEQSILEKEREFYHIEISIGKLYSEKNRIGVTQEISIKTCDLNIKRAEINVLRDQRAFIARSAIVIGEKPKPVALKDEALCT